MASPAYIDLSFLLTSLIADFSENKPEYPLTPNMKHVLSFSPRIYKALVFYTEDIREIMRGEYHDACRKLGSKKMTLSEFCKYQFEMDTIELVYEFLQCNPK